MSARAGKVSPALGEGVKINLPPENIRSLNWYMWTDYVAIIEEQISLGDDPKKKLFFFVKNFQFDDEISRVKVVDRTAHSGTDVCHF